MKGLKGRPSAVWGSRASRENLTLSALLSQMGQKDMEIEEKCLSQTSADYFVVNNTTAE